MAAEFWLSSLPCFSANNEQSLNTAGASFLPEVKFFDFVLMKLKQSISLLLKAKISAVDALSPNAKTVPSWITERIGLEVALNTMTINF